MLICWLIGWPCVIAGSLMMYMVIKKVTIPYNKIAFEATNDHGVVDLEKWNDAVNFKKIEAKKNSLKLG